ncbi:MAG: hypothetical protein BVN35_02705 [Proteobacteria bacterium ST_bin11]|nr:MAG: hypothetical protein BVN35_02705 [Proteobacteria bacterium ST_bin11]
MRQAASQQKSLLFAAFSDLNNCLADMRQLHGDRLNLDLGDSHLDRRFETLAVSLIKLSVPQGFLSGAALT